MGTMRERAQGTWELSVAAGRDPDTGAYRRVIRTVKGVSKREAKAALAELEVAVAAGRVGANDPTLAELLERWMEHLAGLGRSDSTLYNYRRYIDREIVPVLGSNRLSKPTGPRAPSLSGRAISVVPSRRDGDRSRISSSVGHSFAL